MSRRTPLGRVLGLGSAKDGTAHWWAMRVSSVASVPLSIWFLYSLLALPTGDYDSVKAWLQAPISSFLSVLSVTVLTHHSYLGTMVVVEDYVHGSSKVITLMTLKFLYVLVGGAAIFAILRVAFGS